MAQVTVTNGQARLIFQSLIVADRTNGVPHKIKYAGVRNRPRLQGKIDEIEAARTALNMEYGKIDEETGEISVENNHIVFATPKKEAAYMKAHGDLMAETFEFDAFQVDSTIIDKMEEGYDGSYGFLDALMGVLIIDGLETD